MILAGPKSYYDEYLRKKGTNKTLSDPPSLLTDRGAYVNFLEVQLERVSAACLSVQSYEDRFQDQHGMVHALEQRCSSMTKLLSLAQQCTEEVRVEANQGIERISKEFQLYKAEQQRINESYKQRIEALECIINDSFPDFGSKLKLMQQKSDEQEQLQQAQIEDLTQQQQQLQHQCEVLTASQVEVQQLIENNRATISRVTFDVEEHSARANNFMRNAEQRLQQQADEHRDQLDNKLSSIQAKISQEQERLQEQWDAQSHEVQAAVREHYGRMSREVQAMRSQCEEEVESVAARVQDDLEQRYGKLRKSLDSSVAEIRAEGERQREQLLQLEEEMLSQVGGVQQTVSQLSDRQEQLSIAHDKSQLVTAGELTALQRRAKRQSERVDQLDSCVASFAEENSRSISAVETNMRSLHEEALMASEALQQQHVADKEELLRLHEEALGSSRVLEDQQREDRARIQQLLEETMTMSRVMEEHHKHDQDQLHELEAHERQDVELLRKEQQYEIKRLQQEERRWQREQEQRLKLREDEQAERFQQWQQQQRQYPSGQQQHQQQQQQQRSQSQYFMFPHDSVLGSPSVVLPPPHYQQQFANMQQADPRLFSPIRRSQSADYQQGPAYQQFPADASLIADDAEGVGGPMSARKPVKGVTIDIKSSASERRYSSDGRGRPPQQQRGPVQRPSRSRSNDAMQHAPAAAAATAATACKTGSSSSGSSNSSASSDEDNEPLRKALVTLLTSDAKDPDTVRRL